MDIAQTDADDVASAVDRLRGGRPAGFDRRGTPSPIGRFEDAVEGCGVIIRTAPVTDAV